MQKLFATLVLVFLCSFSVGIAAQGPENIADYRHIPGVTQKEIDAIEAIKKSGRTFVYGGMLSSEAFPDENGAISGYAAHITRLLSKLFGIEFSPVMYDWKELFDGLAETSIDFSGEFTATPERRGTYLMSGDIAVRPVGLFYPAGGKSIEEIATFRTPVIGFLRDSVPLSQFSEMFQRPFEPHYFSRLAEAAEALAVGKIDVFVGDSSAEPALQSSRSPEIVTQIYSPPIYNSMSLSTKNPDLWAIISVFDKFIESGGQGILSEKYSAGMGEYNRSVVRNKLTSKEKAYIDRYVGEGKKIPIILESGNYPISFYNEKSKKYEGIVPDLLANVTKLTGLQFEAINAPEEDWPTVLGKLQTGKAAIISELLHTSARDGLFLWPKEPSSITRFALLSKRDYPNLEAYEMLGKRIGVEIDTAYHDIAKQWFPNVELLTFSSIDEAFDAMDAGKIDLIMASENLLLSQTNYSEKPDYKVNLAIDYTAESKLGFNIEQKELLSIFDKTFPYTKNDVIVRRWVSRVYDYSTQLAQARVDMLTVSTVLLVAFMALLATFLFKINRHRRDLSSLVKARTAQLEEKTATLSTIYKAIPDLLFSKDTKGRYTSCNPSFEACVGMPESEVLGKYASDVFSTLERDSLDIGAEEDAEVIETGASLIVEQVVPYPDGTQRSLETIKTPLRQNNMIVGMLGISRDITAHRDAQDAAQAASKAKSSFLALMSHEMRTPLNAIIGMAEITKASVGNIAKTTASVEQIIVSSHHLLRLINDVLDMSKIESGKLELLERPFCLREALDETLTMITPRCQEKGIVFQSNVQELPALVIVGDNLRLNQVLINLLSNATKFTDTHGHLTFTVSILNETAEDIRIRFAVKDSGIGMSKEQIARLFKPFEQADSSIASRFGGTGLGLSISHNLVQGMGGTIAIDSTLGQGSEFSFELLFSKGELVKEPEQAHSRVPDFTGSRILLADDIEINRLIVEELLSPTHLTIETAANGREAVERFERSVPGHYHLVFMDIQMPEMNGYEATTAIRALAHPNARSVPIIAMTANAYKEDVEQSIAVGMNGHIGKPIDTAELMRVLVTHLEDVGME